MAAGNNRMLTQRQIIEGLVGAPREPAAAEALAFAPANIALCKYWGKRDTELNLPITSSLSISLGRLGSETLLRPAATGSGDRLTLNGGELTPGSPAARRVSKFLDPFRPAPGAVFELEATNTVPTAAGFASSASGFAALTLALDKLFGWELDPRRLSILARLGSGSACRSLFEGFVEWHAGTAADGMDSFAERLDADWPQLRVGLVVICAAPKEIGSRPAMQRTVASSVLYRAWPEQVARDLGEIKAAIRARDFPRLGRAAENNALAMHATMLAARPPVLYWQPASLTAMRQAWELREQGVEVYFTMDAGPNLKLLFLESDAAAVQAAFPDLQVVAPFGY